MLLKDLVWRSALRRGAGETEVSSFSPQVFEVTDLLIPAGTDWTTAAHQLGSLTVSYPDALIAMRLYIELDETPDVLDSVDLVAIFDGWNPQADPALGDRPANPSAGLGRGLVQGQKTAIEWEFGNMNNLPTVTVGERTINIGISTGDVTTADITVLRASAAFLVI